MQVQQNPSKPPISQNNASKQATSKSTKATQPKKSALKTPVHKHAHPRTIVESSIQLPAEKPKDHFIGALKELLRNGKIVDKHFAFAPVKKGEGDYLISEANSIPTNMTILSKHFKVSYQGTKNSFKKQKMWNKNRKVKDKDEFCEPTVFFNFTIATEEEPRMV